MDWTFSSLFESIESHVGGIYDSLRRETREGGLRSLVSPVDPFNRSKILTPLVAAAGIVSVVMLSGLAVSAFVTALTAFLALYYLLTQVFGYELSMVMPGPGTV